MKLKKWPSMKRDVLGVLALGLTVFLFSCLKAGDGVGLNQDGSLFVPNPCIANPNGPTCPDPCIANPTGPGCPDPCIAKPAGPGCQEQCNLPSPPARCSVVVVVDSCHREVGSLDPKPDSCLDRKFFADSVVPIFKLKCYQCHLKPNGLGYTGTKLSLDSVDAWDSLVNVKALEITTFYSPTTMIRRVVPGIPDSSYLYRKIVQAGFIPQTPAKMPAGAPPLPANEIAIIKKWITGRN